MKKRGKKKIITLKLGNLLMVLAMCYIGITGAMLEDSLFSSPVVISGGQLEKSIEESIDGKDKTRKSAAEESAARGDVAEASIAEDSSAKENGAEDKNAQESNYALKDSDAQENMCTLVNISESPCAYTETLEDGGHIYHLLYNEKWIELTDIDRNILLRLVEAEAPSEDVLGRMLVANVVLNRVTYKFFHDNVHDVVFSKGQFAVIEDTEKYPEGVSELTVEAVDRVLAGEDYSEGALFFIAKAMARKESVIRFDRELEYLYKYGVHTFYTFK